MSIKGFNKQIITVFLALSLLSATIGQDGPNEKKQVQDLVESKNYVFVAQAALPIGGRSINLTATNELRISADTIVSNLPYFGRAFVAPINPSDGGIQFTSTDFSYQVKERKKGGWDITRGFLKIPV